MGDELLTTREAADLLGMKKSTLYEMVKRGDLPAAKIGKQLRFHRAELETFQTPPVREEPKVKPTSTGPRQKGPQSMVFCGQDSSLDLFSNYVTELYGKGTRILRAYTGSMDSLSMLYHGRADIAVIHLWNEAAGDYNLPYIKTLLPGQAVMSVRLFGRFAGWYVQRGNPKNIEGWQDLRRQDLALVNREKGSGTRVLLDEKLKAMGLPASLINGYRNEQVSDRKAAEAVACGEGDLALGTQMEAGQMPGIWFIPLQLEWYDMVFLADWKNPCVQATLDFVCSGKFARELSQTGGYDLSQTGKILHL